LSHSHIPVKHLLKQLEIYRSNRRNRDIRPPWLTELIERLSGLFEPADDVARVGFDCRWAEDGWELMLFLGRTEVVGGPQDGQTKLANFRLDLLTVLDNFSEVDHVEWHANPQTPPRESEADPSLLEIRGLAEEESLTLLIFAAPPTEMGPGIRENINGDFEAV